MKEPITVQYPLLRFARDRTSVQLLLAGIGVGIIGLHLVPAAFLAYVYDVSSPVLTKASLLQSGLLASLLANGFLIATVVAAATGWLARRAGIELSNLD